MNWIFNHIVELTCFGIAIFFTAVMDHFRDRIPEDSGYFSHKTGADKNDIWHHSKRIALFFFALSALGTVDLYFLFNNTYVWVIILAYSIQKIFYNGVFKWFSQKKTLDK